MAAYDALPEVVRAALQHSSAQHSAVEVKQLLDQGWDDDRVVECIMLTDAVMVQSEPLVKEVVNG